MSSSALRRKWWRTWGGCVASTICFLSINVYNAANQLVGFADGETTASYAYNSNGLRVEKIVDGQKTNHVWDGSQQIVADIIDSEYYEAQCYIRGTSLAATYRYQNAVKSGYTYYVQNAHGDVVNLTDADGAVTKTYRYDAFGVEFNLVTGDVNVSDTVVSISIQKLERFI